jgi:hypothetical protein
MSTETQAKKWHSKAGVQFPKDNYLVQCVEQEIGQTQKGAPTIKTDWEIRSPEYAEVAGENYEVVGIKIKHTQYLKSVADGVTDETKTAKMLDMTSDFYEKCGENYNRNPDQPNMVFKGKYMWVILDNKESAQRKNPTQEQLKAGRPGDVMKHPVTGEDMVLNYPEITSFTCIGEKPANDPLA